MSERPDARARGAASRRRRRVVHAAAAIVLSALAAAGAQGEGTLVAASGDHLFAVIEVENGVRPGRRIPVLVHHPRDLVRAGVGVVHRPIAPAGRRPDRLAAGGTRVWLLYERRSSSDAAVIVSRELFTQGVERHGLHEAWFGVPRDRIERAGDLGSAGRLLDLVLPPRGIPALLVAVPDPVLGERLRLLVPGADTLDADVADLADDSAVALPATLPDPTDEGPIEAAVLRCTEGGTWALLVQRRGPGGGPARPDTVRCWTRAAGDPRWRRRADLVAADGLGPAEAVVASGRLLVPRAVGDTIEVHALEIDLGGASGIAPSGWRRAAALPDPGGEARLVALEGVPMLVGRRDLRTLVLQAEDGGPVPVVPQVVDASAPMRGPAILSILSFAAVLVAILWPAPVRDDEADAPGRAAAADDVAPDPRAGRLGPGPRAAAALLDHGVAAGIAMAAVGVPPLEVLLGTLVPGVPFAQNAGLQAWLLAAGLNGAIGLACEAWFGRTLGLLVVGGAVVRPDGGRPRLVRLAVRRVLCAVMAVLPPLGLVAIVRRSMRPVHDVLGDVEVRAEAAGDD